MSPLGAAAKRALDLSVSASALVALAPVIAATAGAARLSMEGISHAGEATMPEFMGAARQVEVPS